MSKYSNSPYVVYTKLSPNINKGRIHPRYNPSGAITKFTPHYVAGNCTIEVVGAIFAPESRKASSTYGIGSDGRIGQYVDESNRPWTSSSPANDYNAVTVEVANISNVTGEITPQAWAALVKLGIDVFRRNGIPKAIWNGTPTGTITTHDMFSNTACPGKWLKSRMGQLADEINKGLGVISPEKVVTTVPKPVEGTTVSYSVRVTDPALNVRCGPGTDHAITSVIKDKGVYGIVGESSGVGASKWGRLENGQGWVALGLTEKLPQTTTPPKTIKPGVQVTVNRGAKFWNDKEVPNWVRTDTWIVASVNGSRVVIDKNVAGTNSICSPIDAKYLTLV